MSEQKFKIRRTFSAPLLVLVCCIALALSSMIDPGRLSSNDNIYLSVIVLQMLIFLIPGIIYCKLSGEKCTENLRIKALGPRKLFFALFAFVTLLAGTALIKLGLYSLGYSSTSYTLYENYIPADTSGLGNVMYILIALAVLPAVTEEFIFRGILMQEYRAAGCSRTCAVMLSSLLFALIHFNIAQLPVYFFGGVVFGFVMTVADSLTAAVLVHFLNNAFSLFFETSLLRLISQTDSMIFVMFTFAVIFMLFLVLSLHEAETIIYDRGMTGADPPFGVPSKKERARSGSKLLEAIISPTFILCIAAFFIITFGIK